jgi:hypothetical protein
MTNSKKLWEFFYTQFVFLNQIENIFSISQIIQELNLYDDSLNEPKCEEIIPNEAQLLFVENIYIIEKENENKSTKNEK